MNTQTKKDELKEILERLNNGERTEQVKREAKELLENISPKELSEAEQELIDAGLPETELRHLCTAHIEAMEEELKALKTDVKTGHPLYTFIYEHEEILKILDNLDELNEEIQSLESYDQNNIVFNELKEAAKQLLETEKHHEREEDALFPEVDSKGVTGPTRIMRMEHEDLWPHKESIAELADKIHSLSFEDFKERLNEHVQYVVLTMKDHIFKENNILYPTAKEVIAEKVWNDIKKKADEIGYCSFSQKER
ncbi:MAG: DUF438 domain-containing protein [Halanaerobiales bacterium]